MEQRQQVKGIHPSTVEQFEENMRVRETGGGA